MSADNASYVADKRRVELLQELQQLRGGIGHVQYKNLTQLPLFHLGVRNTSHELDLAKLRVVAEEIRLVADLFRRGPDGTMPGEPSLYAENVDNVLNRLHHRLQLLEDGGKLLQHEKQSVHPETEHEPELQQRKAGHAPAPRTTAAVPSPTALESPPEHQHQHHHEHQEQGQQGRRAQQPRDQRKLQQGEEQVRKEADEVSTESVPTEPDKACYRQPRTDGDVQTKGGDADVGGSVWDPTDDIDRCVGPSSPRDNGQRGSDRCRMRKDGGIDVINNGSGNGQNVGLERTGPRGESDDDSTVHAIIDNNKGNGQVFNKRRWRVHPKSISVPMYCDGRPNGTYEYVSSTAENLRAATQEAFPQFGTPGCNQHGLSKRDYDDMKKLCARLKVVARVQLNDPCTGGRFVEYFIRATDDEVKAALNEDGAAAEITVEVYTRAALIIRSRQAAAKAAKEPTTAATATTVEGAAGAAESSFEGIGRDAVEYASRTGTGSGGGCGVVPWQKRARTA